jgi:hypothetical protein
MSARVQAIAVMTFWLLTGSLCGQEIHLKTRNIRSGATSRAASQMDTHQLVQFDHAPSVEDLNVLLAAGAQVVSVVPDNAVVVSTPGALVPTGQGILNVMRLDPEDKLSPDLGTAEPIFAVVEFHGDVSTEVQNAVASAEGLTLQQSAVLLSNHALVTGTLSDLQALAAHDEVAYIFPADPALLTDSTFSACAGMLTLSGSIAQYSNLVHGWTLDSDNVAHLGYVFGTLTTKVPASLVQSEVLRALNAWAQITNVAFQPGTIATAARTLAIKFASGAHGDAYPFDGPGGVLAHTFYPVPVNPESIAGDMHLDADENWHSGADVDIFSVALHEAGHAIGLGHSDKPGDVMYPYYRRGMALSANDIGAAQALYGAPNAAVTAAPAPVTVAATTPATLQLTLNSSPASTQNAQVALTGTISGGAAPFTVQWMTDHGFSGQAALGGLNWTASGISLVNGSNTISVTAFDANHQAATQSASMSLVPATGTSSSAAAPTSPVTIAVTSPAASMVSVNSATLSMGGTASGGNGITRVTWQTSTGTSGTATGTSHWLITGIPVLVGTNTVVVRAYDANGNTAWAAVVAVRN